MASPHVAGAADLDRATTPGGVSRTGEVGAAKHGNLNWDNVDDPDGIKERLLNVDAL